MQVQWLSSSEQDNERKTGNLVSHCSQSILCHAFHIKAIRLPSPSIHLSHLIHSAELLQSCWLWSNPGWHRHLTAEATVGIDSMRSQFDKQPLATVGLSIAALASAQTYRNWTKSRVWAPKSEKL